MSSYKWTGNTKRHAQRQERFRAKLRPPLPWGLYRTRAGIQSDGVKNPTVDGMGWWGGVEGIRWGARRVPVGSVHAGMKETDLC
jgi:hypothetical protein